MMSLVLLRCPIIILKFSRNESITLQGLILLTLHTWDICTPALQFNVYFLVSYKLLQITITFIQLFQQRRICHDAVVDADSEKLVGQVAVIV